MSGDDEFPALDLGEPAPPPRPRPRPKPRPATGADESAANYNPKNNATALQPDPNRPASFACYCGFRDEVKQPAPDRLDCPECRGLETLRSIAPRYDPPRGAGRELTPHERKGLALDAARSAGVRNP